MSQSLSLSKTRLLRFMAGVLCVGMLLSFTATPAQALTPARQPNPTTMSNSEMLALIQVLMAQVAQLQQLLAAKQAAGGGGGFQPQGIALGATVQTTDLLKVRQNPSVTAQQLGYQNTSAQGKVTSGPRSADGYTWWYIDYNVGVDGWSAQNWLRPVYTPVTLTPANPTPGLGCELTTDKALYRYGEQIKLTWKGIGAAYANFVNDTSGKDSIYISPEKQSANGSAYVSASVLGLPNFTLKVTAADGRTSQCDLTVKVDLPTTTSPTTGNSNAQVEFVDSNTTTYITPGGNNTTGFEIEFDVIAIDDDVYVGDTVPAKDGVRVYFDGPGDPTEAYYTIDSNADEENGYYVVQEGESETFVVKANVKTVPVSGQYRMGLDTVMYRQGYSSGSIKSADMVNIPDFKTPYVYLTAGAAVGCVSGTQTYPEGTKRTSIINPDGTSSSIADAYYVCRSGVWKIEGGLPAPGIAFTASVTGVTARVDFGLSNGCAGYVIDWGDGKTQQQISSSNGPICTQIYTPVSLVHTYPGDGTWTIKLTSYSGGTKGAVTTKTVNTLVPMPAPGDYKVYKDNSLFYDGYQQFLLQSDALNHCKQLAANYQTAAVRCTWNGTTIFDNSSTITPPTTVSSVAPQKNYFACNRSLSPAQTFANGQVACYGMWDYGNDFGGDVNMCGSYNGSTGCNIPVSACASSYGSATKYYSNSALSNNASKLSEVAANLQVTTSVAKAGIAGLWEYTCSSNDSFGYSSGSVLGASTDSKANLQTQIDAMRTLLNSMLNRL